MNYFVLIIASVLKITLLDIVLSGDNIGIIALATKDLPLKLAKKASLIGVMAAITLRILFTCFVTYLLMIESLPIKLIGGLLLIYITFDFIKPSEHTEKNELQAVKSFNYAIFSIIIADLTMSLDNVLAVAASAHGNIRLIIFGLILNIPIIFWGSLYVSKIMNKYPIVIYIGGAFLAHTAFDMFLNDKLISSRLPVFFVSYIPIAAAIITFSYGYYITTKKNGLGM